MSVKSYTDRAGRKRYYCSFYYTDFDGTRKRKKIEGFSFSRDAKKAQDDFLQKMTGNANLSFRTFCKIYIDDCKTRLKPSSIHQKEYILNTHCVPFYGDTLLSDISPTAVRNWQNSLLSQKPPFKPTYLRACNTHLSALFNFAVKYYNLRKNPVTVCGTIGKLRSNRIDFYTATDYRKFAENLKDKPIQLAFEILFFTGVRCGELLALNVSDFNENTETISISKTLTRIHGKDIITTPKTKKSNRTVTLPHITAMHIKEYIDNCMIEPQPKERLFHHLTSYALKYHCNKAAEKAGLKHIRIHDFRHSHASLLIELGFSPLLISERLGHENIETTLAVYSHLYADKASEVASRLNQFL